MLLTSQVARWRTREYRDALAGGLYPGYDAAIVVNAGVIARLGVAHQLTKRLHVSAYLTARNVVEIIEIRNGREEFTRNQLRNGGFNFDLYGSFLTLGIQL